MGSEGFGASPPPQAVEQHGVTRPISLARPTEADKKRNLELGNFLVESGLYESDEETSRRKEVLGKIDQVKVKMATLRNLKIKTGTCKRILKELHSYEKEVEKEAAKTADMKEKGADPYDLKQQENVLAESRMMIPDCRKRLEASLADIKGTLAELEERNQEEVQEIVEARSVITEVEVFFQTTEA